MYISATLTHPDPVLGFHPPAPLHGNGVVVVLDVGGFRLMANNPANPPAPAVVVVGGDVHGVTVDGSLPMAKNLAGVLDAVRDKMTNTLTRK